VDGAAEDLGIAGETPRPVVVGHDGIGMCARSSVVIRGEKSAECGLKTEDREHRAGDVLHVALFHFIIGGIGEVGAVGKGGGDELSLAFGGGAHAGEVGIGEVVEGAEHTKVIGPLAGESVETIGVRDGERAEEERVDEAESGGTGADGEGEREDGGGGGDFALEQLAPTEGEVGAEAMRPQEDFNEHLDRLVYSTQLRGKAPSTASARGLSVGGCQEQIDNGKGPCHLDEQPNIQAT
jgi:hypothetical protein